MEEQEWDFTAVYFPTIDHFGHLFMHYNPPKMESVSQADFELYRYVMEGCYRFHDMMLATLLKQAGKETTVMIVSDHGYYSGSQRPNPETALTDPESWHRSMGIACLYGPGIKKRINSMVPHSLILPQLSLTFLDCRQPWIWTGVVGWKPFLSLNK